MSTMESGSTRQHTACLWMRVQCVEYSVQCPRIRVWLLVRGDLLLRLAHIGDAAREHGAGSVRHVQ